MTRPLELLQQGRKEELWQMCCGFLKLSLEQFMGIQKRLLLEQIGLLENCEMGRRLLGGARPLTVEEFRTQVPLTTYDDYLPELTDKREDVLPARPAMWVHTIGKPGDYTIKNVPMSERFLSEFERVAGGVGLLASCNERGEFPLREHMKVLSSTGSRFYGAGIIGYLLKEALGCDFLAGPASEAPFQERTKAAFKEALCRGIDAPGGLSTILVYVGELLKQEGLNLDARFLLSHPQAAARLLRGLAKSKLARRPLLPRDLWDIKIALGGGTDGAVFRQSVEELWGKRPLEIYGGTEGGIYATQTWDYEGMTFVPHLSFFEFIPEREWFKWQLDRSYQPKTVLLNEVRAGHKYEIVITNFHGGIMTRYRPGDMIKITALRNDKLGIAIPQMEFDKRADDLIILFGVGHLTEKLIAEAIENTGIPYADWTARKEVLDGRPALHIYLEIADHYIASEQSVAASVYHELEKLDAVYRFNLHKYAYGDALSYLKLKPLAVSFLPQGAIAGYIAQRRSEGAAREASRPPRINPSDQVLSLLRAPEVAVEAAPATEAERARTR